MQNSPQNQQDISKYQLIKLIKMHFAVAKEFWKKCQIWSKRYNDFSTLKMELEKIKSYKKTQWKNFMKKERFWSKSYNDFSMEKK